MRKTFADKLIEKFPCHICVASDICPYAFMVFSQTCKPFTVDDAMKIMIDKIAKAMIQSKTD